MTAQVPGVRPGWRNVPASPALLLTASAVVFLCVYAILLGAGYADELTILPYHVPALVSLVILWKATRAAHGRERLGLLLLAGIVVFALRSRPRAITAALK